MNKNFYIKKLTSELSPAETGNKAQSLIFLQRHGFRIPHTLVVISRAYNDFLTAGELVLNRLKNEIAGLPDFTYAVRSSTNIEDSTRGSFAGQFMTFTNVRGETLVYQSVLKVWESVKSYIGSEYRSRMADITSSPGCAVIIQEMVKAELSGVSFSRNPVTQLNEVVIEAVEGPGEELVQKGTTPLRWRFRGERVNEGNTEYRHFRIINQVAEDTRRLAKKYGKPADIEWVYDGDRLYYLQIREITGSKKTAVYSNRMAREMLPGQIKPLVWSVNIPLVNGTWIKLLERITGPLKTTPDQLAKPFYYQAYFNMVALGEILREFGFSAESMEGMLLDNQAGMPRFRPKLKTLKHTFRIIRLLWHLNSFESSINKEYAILKNRFTELEREIEGDFSLDSYNDFFGKLFNAGQEIARLNIIVPILMQFHSRRFRKKLQKIQVDDDKVLFSRYFPELIDLSPLEEMKNIRRAVEKLPGYNPQSCNNPEALAELPGSAVILEDIRKFLQKFGHFSDVGTDFSVPKWEENPGFVFQMIMQTEPVKEESDTIGERNPEPWLYRNNRLERRFLKAGKFRVYREKISTLYIFGYGLFRKLFLNVALEFKNRDILDEPEDIFYLRREEIEQLLNESNEGTIKNFRETISKRRNEMQECREISLPAIIFGDDLPTPLTGKMKIMKGLGVSPGQFTGKTTVIKQTSEFLKVTDGDVLIIPFADVSWTPILVKAGAIVSEAGGMLSHCSIIARELGIPALVSVDNALMTGDGVQVTVDGSNGVLTIHDNE